MTEMPKLDLDNQPSGLPLRLAVKMTDGHPEVIDEHTGLSPRFEGVTAVQWHMLIDENTKKAKLKLVLDNANVI